MNRFKTIQRDNKRLSDKSLCDIFSLERFSRDLLHIDRDCNLLVEVGDDAAAATVAKWAKYESDSTVKDGEDSDTEKTENKWSQYRPTPQPMISPRKS